MSKIFEIKENGSLGHGLFAVQPIEKGGLILEFTGPIISLAEALQKPADKLSCPLQIGPTTYIDLEGPGVLANHSCSPNAGVKNDRFKRCAILNVRKLFLGCLSFLFLLH